MSQHANNQPLVFISHSSEDEQIAKHLIALLNTMGIVGKKICCTSAPGYRLPLEGRWYDKLRTIFTERKPYVIFIQSKAFYESPVCMNEMGAVWALNLQFASLLVKGFEYEDMVAVIPPSELSIKLDEKSSNVKEYLRDLKKKLIAIFDIDDVGETIWDEAMVKFIHEANSTSQQHSDKDVDDNINGSRNLLSPYIDRPPVPIAPNMNPHMQQYVNIEALQMAQNDRQKILQILESGSFTIQEIAQKTALSKNNVAKAIQGMMQENLVAQHGNSVHATFRKIK